MKFIKSLSAIAIIHFSINSIAQFGVNGVKGYTVTSSADVCFDNLLKANDIAKLKKMTTYFVCPKNLLDDIDELQIILDDAWNLNDIVVIKQKDMYDHLKEKNAAFFSMSMATYGASLKEIYYQLWSIKDFSKPITSFNMIEYCRFSLNYTCELTKEYKSLKDDEAMFEYLYEEANFNNFKPGIIANYLKLFDDYLSEEKYLYCTNKITNNDALQALKNDTLYITSNFKKKIKASISMACELDEEQDITELMEEYPYTYAFISFEELNDKIENGDDFYYAICVKSQGYNKHISVFNNKKSECIYNRSSPNASFTKADLKHLAKEIEK
ncbi:MAG: hypothetical protein ACKVQB_08030 [Bacteroidia bacterium]